MERREHDRDEGELAPAAARSLQHGEEARQEKVGAQVQQQHPAPYPLALAERLIRMFSFVGDTVLDPFMGTGTTNLAAGLWGRNSIGYEIEPEYFSLACRRVRALKRTQLTLDSISSAEVNPPCPV